MTFQEAQEELIRHRNLALTKHGNALLGRGLDVNGEEFRKSMLRYAGDLETWRMWAVQEVAVRAFGATTAQSAERH